MIGLIGCLAGLLLYLEIIYHLSGFGMSGGMPLYVLMQILAWSSLASLAIGLLKGIWKKIAFYGVLWLSIVWAGAQVVYLHIFKQPLLWEGIFRGGGDALTNYWREALEGILQALPFLLLLAAPGVAVGLVIRFRGIKLPDLSSLQILRLILLVCAGVMGEVVTLEAGKALGAEYYEEYRDFYAPLSVAEKMGFLPMLQRDTGLCTAKAAGELWEEITLRFSGNPKEKSSGEVQETVSQAAGEELKETISGEAGRETAETGGQEAGTEAGGEETKEQVPELPKEHRLAIDFELLSSCAQDEKDRWLTDYIQAQQPSKTNEYTGIFEGYNLIYLTAEGFSPYGVREDLAPTLYRMINSGFVFENYYVPLWQTSTSDGEYINCTGLIPDGQFSMRKSGSNTMPFTLPAFFAGEGVQSLAYHNNSLSYYDRYITHPNLGYDFKGCKLGNLSEEEWGDKIFPMEHPDAWPASDLEMLQGTVPEYINRDRFHVYYMTVSGHMNYNFKGNAMASKNKEAVEGLELSENARAYIACHIELDKALSFLLEQLEAAGVLERTVICMSADHYPYGMTMEQYEELAGKPLSEGMDLYRNSLILWNSAMEKEPMRIEKACGSMDIVPTLLNLFGFSYDSRMYAGRDILSQEEGLVIFNDRSFVTDSLIYNRKGKQTIWLLDENGQPKIPEEQQEAYLEEKKQEVKERYQFSAYVLQTDYYSDVLQALPSPPKEDVQ